MPITFRWNGLSGRLRYYHQSSHLGDEFILGNPGVGRINLSFEELEIIASIEELFFERYDLRFYVGHGYLIRREPIDFNRLRWQYGGEFRFHIMRHMEHRDFYFLAASDIRQLQENRYDPDISIKTGLELARDSGRRFRILFSVYDGFNPFGQFYKQEMRAIGVEINLGF